MRIERLAQEKGLQLRWRFFPLHPEIPPEGAALSSFLGDDPKRLAEIQNSIFQALAAEGLPYKVDLQQVYSTRRAQELALWAQGKDGGARLHSLLYQGFLAEERNLHEWESLFQIAEEAGLDAQSALKDLQEGKMKKALDEEWQYALGLGVSSIPTLLLNKWAMVGAQPYEKMLEFAAQALNKS